MNTYDKHDFYKIILSYIVGDYTYEDTFFVFFSEPVTYAKCKETVAQDYIGYNPKKHIDTDNEVEYPHRCFAQITHADSDDIAILNKYDLVSIVNTNPIKHNGN